MVNVYSSQYLNMKEFCNHKESQIILIKLLFLKHIKILVQKIVRFWLPDPCVLSVTF